MTYEYECFIPPAFHTRLIEAESAEAARKVFVEMIRECLEEEHVIANNMDTEDGEDPKKENKP